MSSTTIFQALGDFFQWTFQFFDVVGDFLNWAFILLGFFGLFYWLNKQKAFNKEASDNSNQIK